ncbi:MAG: type I-C CRISPR-associated protein Cas5c [Verrucomicrobia bacterium]|nr:type I-C CRISPR-associated protein Cas5c [Verrucomicrobiota bacterium]MBU1693357.1 type I-C CRISPR-associated protein Cas5c [Verrucomicrobiota bacterium]
MLSERICLRVKGPFACFTRPEFHVERVSYPVITPAAARGVLEAILMKPTEKPESHKRDDKVGFHWDVLRLGIIRKGCLVPILRNELGYARHAAYGFSSGYDVMEERTQRQSLILKDVEYLIEAVIEVAEFPDRRGVARLMGKYHNMFLRRARAGQCFYQPFLGCREFSASEWELVEPAEQAHPNEAINDDFGMIFRDFDFDPVWKHWGDDEGAPRPTDWTDPADARKVASDEKYMVHPIPRKPLHAVADRGWITVATLVDGDKRVQEVHD